MKDKLNLIALRIWRELKQEQAQDLLEFALLLGLLSLAVIASIQPIGDTIHNYYLYIHSTLQPYM